MTIKCTTKALRPTGVNAGLVFISAWLPRRVSHDVGKRNTMPSVLRSTYFWLTSACLPRMSPRRRYRVAHEGAVCFVSLLTPHLGKEGWPQAGVVGTHIHQQQRNMPGLWSIPKAFGSKSVNFPCTNATFELPLRVSSMQGNTIFVIRSLHSVTFAGHVPIP